MKRFLAILFTCLPALADVETLVVPTGLTWVEGDILFFNGTNWVNLARGTNGQFLTMGTVRPTWATSSGGGGGGSGTVTSVALTAPLFQSVSGSPITTSGTLALSWSNQVANTVLAGPTTGADAAPTFRSLVAADIPSTQATDAEVTAAIASAAANYQPTNATLTSLGNLSTNGALFRIASGTLASRLLVGDTEAVVSNGDGVSGNPTFSIGSSIARDSEVTAALAALLTWTNTWTGPQTFSGGVTIPTLTVTNIITDTLTLPFSSTLVEVNSSSNLIALASTGTGSGVRSNAPSIRDAALIGTPTAPTQSGGTSNTTVATTAFVMQNAGSGGGGGGNVYTSSNNVFTGTNSMPALTLNGQSETNWPTHGVRRNSTKVEGVPYWDFIKFDDFLATGSGTTFESGMQGSANGGSLVSLDVAFGSPGIRRLRVDSTNDAPMVGWSSACIATNTGPECWFVESRARVRTLSVGTSEIMARLGLFSGTTQTNIPAYSAVIVYDTNRVGTTWGFLSTSNSVLGTVTASGTTVVADTWVRLGVALFTDKAIGYINGVPFATNTTTIPLVSTIGAGAALAQVSGTGTANMDLQIDWTEFRYYSGQ